MLSEGIAVQSHRVGDVNGDGVADLTIAFSRGGGSVVLLGVDDFADVDIANAAAFGGGVYSDALALAPLEFQF